MGSPCFLRSTKAIVAKFKLTRIVEKEAIAYCWVAKFFHYGLSMLLHGLQQVRKFGAFLSSKRVRDLNQECREVHLRHLFLGGAIGLIVKATVRGARPF